MANPSTSYKALSPTGASTGSSPAGWLAGLSLLAMPGLAAAQGSHFTPVGSEFVVNSATNFNQFWCKVSIAPDVSRIAFAWTAGQDVDARIFDGNGVPLTGDIHVNQWTTHIQDEPDISFDENGRILIAWSERSGLDGEIMGIFGRIYDQNGAPLTNEFQVNLEWQASQWRPIIEPRPGGGWVVAWTGQWDADAFVRVLDTDGNFLTQDIFVNTFENGGQADTAIAIAPDGTIFVAFVDYSGHSGLGPGTDVWATLLDENGNRLLPQEFRVNSAVIGVDQREPRCAADGLGHFIVVWEDAANDGNSWGIFGRRYDARGVPLGAEFQVNQSTAGAQRAPNVAADWSGNFVVTWQDGSGGGLEVKARRYDVHGTPITDEFLVNTITSGAQKLPDVETEPAGERFVFSWDGAGNQSDCFARIYDFDPITQIGVAVPGGTIGLDLDMPSSAGLAYVLMASSSTAGPGIPLPDGRVLDLFPDALFMHSLFFPNSGIVFSGFQGALDGAGKGAAWVFFAPIPALSGLSIHVAGVTLDLSEIGLAAQLRRVTRPLQITVQ